MFSFKRVDPLPKRLGFRVNLRGMGQNLELFDGILGLAFPSMLDVGTRTLIQDLGDAAGFRNLGFALELRGLDRPSTFSLGEVPELVAWSAERAFERQN